MTENQNNNADYDAIPSTDTNSSQANTEISATLTSTTGRELGNTTRGRGGTSRNGRNARHNGGLRDNPYVSVQKDFEGSTLETRGILGLNTKHVVKKVNFGTFYVRLKTYIIKEFTNGPDVVIIIKDINADPAAIFEVENITDDLTEEEKKSDVNGDIKKEEIKAYVRGLKLVKSNLKVIYNLVLENYIDGF